VVRRVPRGYDSWYDYRERRGRAPSTEAKLLKIAAFVEERGRFPSVREVMELCGVRYDWAAELRREALRRFPRVDFEEVAEAVKRRIYEQVEHGEPSLRDLVAILPYVVERKSSNDIRAEVVHRLVVVKPGEDLDGAEEGEEG